MILSNIIVDMVVQLYIADAAITRMRLHNICAQYALPADLFIVEMRKLCR